MSIIPLAIPPGMHRNGTEFQSSGRWRDGSLVRWTDGTMQPVGGWQARDTVTDQPIRGMHAWRDLSSNRWYAAGTFEALFAVSAGGTTTDITPAGLTAGSVDASANLGYGGGFYGTGAYGTARPDTGSYGEATTWSIDNWGETLVACSPADGVIYDWDLNVLNNGVAVSNAPVDNLGLVVTEERFLFALGAGGNPRKVQWSDREDNTTWTAAATNEAGDIELQTNGQIMLGIRSRGQTLILTDQDAHAATYSGPPFVYGFERVGSSCGAISRNCAVGVDSGVFWMGNRGFYVYSGGAVQELPCEVIDWLVINLNRVQRSKVYGVSNAEFGEIWWFFPSISSTENDSYVSYNYRENHWSTGSVERTAGIGPGVFRNPIYAAPTGVTYTHEDGLIHGTSDVYAESGPISLGNGDAVMSVNNLIPDELTQGDVTVTFKTRFHPNDTERSYGPYTMANPTPVRFTGRQVRLRVDATDTAWRAGVQRIEAMPRGRR